MRHPLSEYSPAGKRMMLAGMVLLAAGCASSVPWQAPYDITPSHPVPLASTKGTTTALPVLRLARVSAAHWLKTDAYQYHLLYQEPQRLLAYRDARWVGTPPQMITSRLQRQLAHSGQWRAVLAGQSSGTATWLLQVRLTDFVVNFSGPEAGKALVAGTATLVNATDYRVVAQHSFRFTEILPGASAQGGAVAMAGASERFVTAVSGWAAQMASTGKSTPRP
ncbi:MAG: ABC-type transport auxiliary lipoprotein family protein [Acidithiobacillus ferriphilus]